MMVSDYSFGQLLDQFRVRHRLSLAALAAKLGVHANTLKNWRRGKTLPRSVDNILRLIEVLQIQPDEANRLLISAGYEPRFGAAETSDSRPLPDQQLPVNPFFIERPALKQALLARVKDRQPVITICGPAGSGKTTLVAQFLADLDSRQERFILFPDGVIVIDFYRARGTAEALRHVLLSMGDQRDDNLFQHARRLLGERRPLFILDGAEEAEDLQAVLQALAGAPIMITTRNRADSPDNDWIELDLFREEEGIALMAMVLADKVSPAYFPTLFQLSSGLPLAVQLICHYLKRQPEVVTEFVEWLQESALQTLSVGHRSTDSVRRLLARSFASFAPATQSLAYCWGLLGFAPIEPALLRTQIDDTRSYGQAVAELQDNYFIRKQAGGWQTLHVLIYQYLREEAGRRPAELEQILSRLGRMEAVSWQAGSGLEHLGALTRWLHENQWWEQLLALSSVAVTLWQKEPDKTVQAILEAIFAAAWAGGHAGQIGQIGILLAQQLMRTGELQAGKEMLARITPSVESVADPKMTADLYRALGPIEAMLGDMKTAEKLFQMELAIRLQLEDSRTVGIAYGNLGIFYGLLERHEVALDYLDRAMTIAREEEDHANEVRWLYTRADKYYQIGQLDAALQAFKHTLTLCQQYENKYVAGMCLDGLGRVYKQQGQIDQAMASHKASLEIAAEMDNKLGTLASLNNLGSLHKDLLADLESALHYYGRAVQLSEALNHAPSRPVLQSNIALILLELGQLLPAERYLRRSLRSARESNITRSEAVAIGLTGELHRLRQQYERAKACYQKAISLAESLGDQVGTATNLTYLARLRVDQHDLDAAETIMKRVVAMYEQLGDVKSHVVALVQVALIQRDLGHSRQAAETFARAQDLCPPYAAHYLRDYANE